jgi:hypothetical protein
MARTRKSDLEKLVETRIEEEQKASKAQILRNEIMEKERRKDTRRKVLDGGMSFAHSRIDPVYREQHADFIHRIAPTLKSGRSQTEALELEKYVRAGCPDFDIERAIEEELEKRRAQAAANVSPPATPPPSSSTKPRSPSPQG